MSNRAWMPLHIADYLADTGHLTALEHGAYLLLIMNYWKDGRLPTDERMIARLAKLTADQWAESRDVLAALFTEGWRHKRIDGELAKADAIISKRKAAAEQMHDNRRANAEQVHSKCSDTGGNTLNQEPTSSLRSEVKRTPRDELSDVLDAEHADAVLDHRQRLRKTLSVRAAKLLASSLAKFPDANAAADRMIEKGWASIEVGWQDAPRSTSPPISSEPRNAGERARLKLNGTLPHEPPHSAPERLDSGDRRGQVEGTGIARRITLATDEFRRN